ncbi:MAG: hypothetical protein HQL98_12995 [Magnetococcales bacterium]|nr:hypothetical protein [Magnetococcales bacterium]
MKKLLLPLLLVLSSTAHAEWQDSLKGALDGTKKIYDETKTAVESSDLTKKATDLIHDQLAKTDDTKTPAKTKQDHFNAIWEPLLDRMNAARDIHDKRSEAPDSSWVKADKKSLNTDFNKILDQIILLLEDETIEKHRTKNVSLREAISKKEAEIQSYKEARISAPIEDTVKTTKEGYDKKIKNAQSEISELKAEIEKLNNTLILQLHDAGLKLNKEQVAILLSRVDSEDIIQMVLVFDVLKVVTSQLMELTSSSGENIAHAKKYYGMHMVLLELIVYMQNKYIAQIETRYAPKLDDLISKTEQLMQSTQSGMTADGESKKSFYQSNIKAQGLLIKTAKLYLKMLNTQKEKVVKARNNAMKDLHLAINTYATVRISSEVLGLLKESNTIFDALINLQIPEIAPFENVEMQKKFEELSLEISK